LRTTGSTESKFTRSEHYDESNRPKNDCRKAEIQQVFINMLTTFLARVIPASTMAKPACIQKTKNAVNKTPDGIQSVYATASAVLGKGDRR
jgi:hypothetical protein